LLPFICPEKVEPNAFAVELIALLLRVVDPACEDEVPNPNANPGTFEPFSADAPGAGATDPAWAVPAFVDEGAANWKVGSEDVAALVVVVVAPWTPKVNCWAAAFETEFVGAVDDEATFVPKVNEDAVGTVAAPVDKS
jgi:hypothetical protein